MVSSRFAAVALVLLLGAAFVACAQGRGGVPRPIDFAIRPATTSVPLGADLSLRVIATYQGGEQVDLTGRCEWTASPSGVATVGDTGSAKGVVTGLAPGSATITARDPASRSVATAALTVTPAAVTSVEVAPSNPRIALGTTRQFTATGTLTDGSTQDLTTAVTWSSSATGVATIDPAGLATSTTAGTTTITALHAPTGEYADTQLVVTAATLVSLQVTPTNPQVALGTTRQFTATGTFSDNTVQDLTTSVVWNSSAPGVATVGSAGLATSVAVGVATITATHAGSGVFGDTLLTVTPAVLASLQVTPTNPSIALGTTRQFTATGTYSDSTTQDLTTAVTWSSSATGVATVSNAGGSQGRATGVAGGTATITALHAGSGASGNTVLTVRPDIQLRAAASAGAASGVLALTVPTPTGALTGDVLLAAIAVRPNTAAVTPPTGWTLVRRIDNAMAAAHSLLVYHRVVMAGEPANHSWTFSASTGSAGGIVAFVNVDTGNIVDVEDGQNTASGVVHTAPSVTTTVAGTMLVTLHAFSSSATWTSPPAMSEAFDVASEALGATGISMSGHYVLRPTAGATGTRAATASNDADVGNTASIALRRSP